MESGNQWVCGAVLFHATEWSGDFVSHLEHSESFRAVDEPQLLISTCTAGNNCHETSGTRTLTHCNTHARLRRAWACRMSRDRRKRGSYVIHACACQIRAESAEGCSPERDWDGWDPTTLNKTSITWSKRHIWVRVFAMRCFTVSRTLTNESATRLKRKTRNFTTTTKPLILRAHASTPRQFRFQRFDPTQPTNNASTVLGARPGSFKNLRTSRTTGIFSFPFSWMDKKQVWHELWEVDRLRVGEYEPSCFSADKVEMIHDTTRRWGNKCSELTEVERFLKR